MTKLTNGGLEMAIRLAHDVYPEHGYRRVAHYIRASIDPSIKTGTVRRVMKRLAEAGWPPVSTPTENAR